MPTAEPENPLVFTIDTETTGFKEPVVPIQFAYARMDGNNPITAGPSKKSGDKFSSMFHPGRPIEYGAISTHGITLDMLDEATRWKDFFWTESPDYLIGHSVDYDYNNIKANMGVHVPRLIDTVGLARLMLADCDSHKQGALAYYVMDKGLLPKNVKKENWLTAIWDSHEAQADVFICATLARIMATMLKTDTWAKLYHVSETARIPMMMPFGKHKDEPIRDTPPDYRDWMAKATDPDPYLATALNWDRDGKKRENRGEWDKHQAAVDRILAVARGDL